MPFKIFRNDITKVKADAIVNTANPEPVIGKGTDAAIYAAAGEKELLAERKKIGVIQRGDAAATPAFNLDAKYIIHTVGPLWEGGYKGEFDILQECYENSLYLARKLKCESVAFPLIATGVYGFPKDKALQIAMSAIESFLMENDMTVMLVVFDKKAFELTGKIVENVREYVNANYVEETHEKEYSDKRSDPRMAYRLKLEQELERDRQRRNEADSYGKVRIDDLLASQGRTFQQRLFDIIDLRGLTGPQVYKNYISKQLYSKIQSDPNYHPTKATALLLCLSLHLNLHETLDLIGRAGWTLSPSNRADLIIRACIMNKEYRVSRIDLQLFAHDCPCLENIK